MKINFLFFTPAVQRSAIGLAGTLIVQELIAKGHNVTVVRAEAVDLQNQNTHDFGVPIIAWNKLEKFPEVIASTDVCIYQIGNYYPFHEGCLHWMPQLPGIVSLHDFFLGGLFLGWLQTRRTEAEAILKNWYGEAIAATYFTYNSDVDFIEGTRHVSPITEWVCSMALGVITHSSWGCERVLNACPGPVRVVPLPYKISPDMDETRQLKATRHPEEIRLVTIGHMNPNKRMESVIKAIGCSSFLKNRITYQLVGPVHPTIKQSLSEIADHLGVKLIITGEVDDATFSRIIADSDIISCLRWPVLEAASASAIEGMLCGKPVICTDAGFYGEIPDEYVFKISIENEIEGITWCLSQLIEKPDLRVSVGAKARDWALNTFVASHYGEALVKMALPILKAKPVIQACKYFSSIAAHWSAVKGKLLSKEDQLSLQIFSPGKEL